MILRSLIVLLTLDLSLVVCNNDEFVKIVINKLKIAIKVANKNLLLNANEKCLLKFKDFDEKLVPFDGKAESIEKYLLELQDGTAFKDIENALRL